MNNINTIDKNNNPKKSNGWRNLGYALMLAGLLNANTPTYANPNNYKNISTEQVSSNTNSINGIKLPTIYQNKLDDFLANNNVMKDNDAKAFTINFVEKEMEADRGISKENQLLFIRHAIYKQVTDQDLYDGKDGNQQIAEDFSNRGVSIRIRVCGQRYKDGIIAYMSELSADAQQRSADAQQRSADAQQRSADAIKETMRLDSLGIKHMIEFYETYIRSPDIVKQDEISFMKESTKKVITQCKKYGINYRAILLNEVGDRRKVEEMLKFYGVE